MTDSTSVSLKSEPDVNRDNDYYYIDIDVLYDVRLILLSVLDEDYATKVLQEGTYFNRMSDAFDIVGWRDFKNLYAQRNENPELLRAAPNTNFHLALQSQAKQAAEMGRKGSVYRPTVFVINIFPYVIDMVEVQELCGVLAEQLAGTVEIQAIWVDPKQLNPAIMASTYLYAAMYDLQAWINPHIEELKSKRYKDFFVTSPALYAQDVPSQKQLEEIRKDSGYETFALAEISLSPVISIQFLPVEFFCIYNEHHKLAKMTEEEKDKLFKLPKSLTDLLDDEHVEGGIKNTDGDSPSVPSGDDSAKPV